MFVRFGRQNLVWGETDVFRLLDNINPIDSSFGGFFIDLDERRVPLNMLRASYNIGTVGPLDQAFIEGYVAIDNTDRVHSRGADGLALGDPPLGPPTGSTARRPGGAERRRCTICAAARASSSTSQDFTFTLASYQTILDIPAVRLRARAARRTPGYVPGISRRSPRSTYAPLVWVNGASMTTALPSLKQRAALRGRLVQERGVLLRPDRGQVPRQGPHPAARRPSTCGTGRDGRRSTPCSRKDTFNIAVGWDTNQLVALDEPEPDRSSSRTQIF